MLNWKYLKERWLDYRLRRKAKRNPQLLYTEQQRQDSPLFFIISCGRSGTTLLRRILMRGGAVHIPPESAGLIPNITRCYLQHTHLPWAEQIAPCLKFYRKNSDFDFWDISLETLETQLLALPDEQRTLRSILDLPYDLHAQRQGAEQKKWGDKTPYLTLHLDWLDILYPDSKYIHLLRDGRAVVASRMKAFGESLEQACNRWKWAIDTVRKFQRKDKAPVLELRYEDLVQQPQASMHQVSAFLGIPYTEDYWKEQQLSLGDDVMAHHANTKKQVSAGHLNKWRQQLSTTQQELIYKQIGKHLQREGYL